MTSDASKSSKEPSSWPITNDAIRDAFHGMLQDGSWGRYHGPHCDELRAALSESHSVEHVLLCSSGTSAVELALRAARVQPGDEVILAAYDYKANFANVLSLGAIPVLIDTLPRLPVLDANQIITAVTKKTKAIICSHLHGCFAPIDQINSVAKERGIVVIEDACQSVGGIIDGRAAGSIGDIGVLSFGGSKLLTAGRGGAVMTNNDTLAQRIRLYTHRGNDAYPLSEMQAAVLLPQLRQLPDRTLARLRSVHELLHMLANDCCLKPALHPDPFQTNTSIPAFFKVAFRYDRKAAKDTSREAFTAAMRHSGIAIDAAFPALHLIHGSSRFRAVGDLLNASDLHETLVTLHHPVLLGSLPELRHVANSASNMT